MAETEKGTMTIREAAKYLGISEPSAYKAAYLGQLPVVKLGRRLLVSRVALERMINEAQPAQISK